MNEIVAVDTALLQELDRANGVKEEQSDGISLPILKAEYNDDAKLGKFVLTYNDETYHADSVMFRPLIQTFKWQNYNFDANEMIVETIEVRDLFTEEPIDTNGTLRCGKPLSKNIAEEDRPKWKDIKFSRIIRGLVTFNDDVKNIPCVLYLKGNTLNAIQDEYLSKIKSKKKHMRDFSVKMTTKQEKKGNVKWYEFVYEPQWDTQIAVDQPTVETIKVFTDMIDDKNKAIRDKYTEALRANNLDSSAIDALQDALGEELKEAS